MADLPKKFLIDEMLGKLSRWLRMLGYDTSFAKDYEIDKNHSVSDKDLIRICLKENRILISRDKDLILSFKSYFRGYLKRKHKVDSNIPCLHLKTQILIEQIKAIYKKFKINLNQNKYNNNNYLLLLYFICQQNKKKINLEIFLFLSFIVPYYHV